MKKMTTKQKATIVISAVLCAIFLMTFIYGSIAFIRAESNPFLWSVSDRSIMAFLYCMVLFVSIMVAFYPGWYED